MLGKDLFTREIERLVFKETVATRCYGSETQKSGIKQVGKCQIFTVKR